MRPWPEGLGRLVDAASGQRLSHWSAEGARAEYGKPMWCAALRTLKPAELRSLPLPDRLWRRTLAAPNVA